MGQRITAQYLSANIMSLWDKG